MARAPTGAVLHVGSLRAKDLVLGVAEKEGDEVVLVKKPAEVLPEGVACGFEGRPDSSGMYRKIGQTTANSDPTAILGKNFENKALAYMKHLL